MIGRVGFGEGCVDDGGDGLRGFVDMERYEKICQVFLFVFGFVFL